MEPTDPPEDGRPAAEQAARSGVGHRERRSADRVSDDQQSGQGAASAWSKFRMLERKRASLQPRTEGD